MLASTLITPRDLLAPAGEPAFIEVEVERRYAPFIDPPLLGALVEMEGTAGVETDAEGQAVIPLGPLSPGIRRVRARVRSLEAEAVVSATPREAPIFITDIDHTIADVSSVGFIFRSVRQVRPIEGSQEALERIARSMTLVYLTARDHIYTAKTKEWLKLNGFPEAPVYLRRRTRFWTVSPYAHKVSRLRELRLSFPNIRFGVGDLPGDVRAYAEHGIAPILFSPVPLGGLPEGTLQISRWSEIADRIAR